MKSLTAALALLAALPVLAQQQHPDTARQAEVARRGGHVMPFDLRATTHVFTKTPSGGVQRVVAKDNAHGPQVALVRGHLRDIQQQFSRGDYSGPSHIHGHDMPGLAELRASPGKLSITYREVAAGAELEYRSGDPGIVATLHRWFDAQLADHGADAMAGEAGAHHSHEK